MTLPDILNQYQTHRENARRFNNWKKLDEFVEELAQLASGTPIITSENDTLFNEVRTNG